MNAGVKIGDLALEILAVFLPCHAVDTGRRIPLQPRVGAVKKPGIDMVEERGEPFLPIAPPTPAPVARRRSPASQLLWRGSDFSRPCITGFGSSPSRCGPGRDRS